MFKNYRPLWWLLAIGLAVFAAVEVWGPVKVCGTELNQTKIVRSVTTGPTKNTVSKPASVIGASTSAGADKGAVAANAVAADGNVSGAPDNPAKVLNNPVDTCAKTILFVGDSMLEGLSPRLAAYARENGDTLYSVIWYSSTSEVWGRSDKLAGYIKRIKPDYIFICLGANELFVRDIAEKRDKYVKKIVSDIGNIPFVWIGPPNWKPDTGINDLIAANVPQGCFFLSNGMRFDRSKDGAHPTRASAIQWMDSVARWMPAHAAHPISMKKPAANTGRPARIFVHQPSEK